MNRLQAALVGLARRLGYTVIPTWRLASFAQAEYLQRLFAHCGVSKVIDVGANEGQYRDFLRNQVGFRGLIISVEPQPELAARLRRRAADEDAQWQVLECALGAHPGTASLKLMHSSVFSSLLDPDSSELTLFRESNAVRAVVDVEVRTLDQVFLDHGLTQRRDCYLKLDTQGFDLEVLRGGQQALGFVAAAQFEGAFKQLYKGAPGYQDVLDFFRESGFEMSAIHPNNEGHFPLLVEQDLHLIHRELLPASHGGVKPPP